MHKPLTEREQAIIAAVNEGHTTVRDIARAVGLTSYSNVARYCRRLEEAGHVVLQPSRYGREVANHADFVAGWDAAARLAGNEEA